MVQQEIERAILQGEYAPGSKLIEATLAQQMGVSRGPVREAFRMLEEAGLVRNEKNRGVFVRDIPIKEAVEIFDLRAAMDELVGRKLARDITPAQLKEIKALVDSMEKAVKAQDAYNYHLLNLKFHDRLVEMAGNGKLTDIYRKLIKELSLFRRLNLADGWLLPISAGEHRQIIKAIASGDADAAGRAMFDHAMDSKERTIENDLRRKSHAQERAKPKGTRARYRSSSCTRAQRRRAAFMTLTWTVVALVLFGALLHAGWNALVKSSPDKALDTAVIHVVGSLIALPLLLFVGWPPAAAWPFILASVVIHIGYYVALTGAYHHGDLGLTYPLMRGTAPLLVALSASLTLAETLSPLSWAGVIGISAGVLALGLSRQAAERPKAVGFALANSVVIAIYTVVDALGVRATAAAGGNAFQYVVALFVLDGWPFALLVLRRRGYALAWPYARARWPVAAGAAAASLGSYGIALWAMTRAPVATVAALRETSVLFAALLGTWFLKEAFSLRRAAATAVIVAGVMALRMG